MDDGEELRKYNLLVQRDTEMQQFIDSFDGQRNAILSDLNDNQLRTVVMLELIGKELEASGGASSVMPGQEDLGMWWLLAVLCCACCCDAGGSLWLWCL